MSVEKLTENARRFANACINTNSIDELRDALNRVPDYTDMREWDISEDEWESAIKTAISEMSN